MIKKILILCLILLQGITSSAMTPEQKKTVLNKISTAAAALPSMTCDFTQTKKVSLVKETMTSQGKMYYKKPDKLRWEYTSPYTYTFIFNGTKVSVKNSKKKSVIDTQSNKVFKEVARIMMNTVTGKALNNPADFKTDVAEGCSGWLVTLIPKRKDMKSMFNKIIITFRKTDCMVTEIQIYEKNGDSSTIKLKNVKSSVHVDDTLFSIH